jgi:hypothetical protein
MVMNGLTKRAENNTLFGQFFPVGGGNRNGVKNGIDRHFAPSRTGTPSWLNAASTSSVRKEFAPVC